MSSPALSAFVIMKTSWVLSDCNVLCASCKTALFPIFLFMSRPCFSCLNVAAAVRILKSQGRGLECSLLFLLLMLFYCKVDGAHFAQLTSEFKACVPLQLLTEFQSWRLPSAWQSQPGLSKPDEFAEECQNDRCATFSSTCFTWHLKGRLSGSVKGKKGIQNLPVCSLISETLETHCWVLPFSPSEPLVSVSVLGSANNHSRHHSRANAAWDLALKFLLSNMYMTWSHLILSSQNSSWKAVKANISLLLTL